MSVLLEPHLTALRAANYSPNTVRDRRQLLTRLDRELPCGIDRATTQELAQWLAGPVDAPWAAWTRATYRQHIASFYHWAAAGDQPWIDYDPAAGLMRHATPDAMPHPATSDQVRLALERSSWRWQIAVSLAAFAGLRAGEISRMRREHITADEITVWKGKGGRDAVLPCHPAIWSRIENRPTGLLIASRTGRAINISALARGYFARLGLPDLHMHMFRHWHACELLRQGTDIRTVQSLMRHRKLETTGWYLQFVDGQRRLAIRTLPVPSESPLQSAA